MGFGTVSGCWSVDLAARGGRLMTLDHIYIPIELFKLPARGLYKISILALIKNFDSKGLRLSNSKLAQLFSVDKRTIERVIAGLKKEGLIVDKGTGKNDRCLVINTDILAGSRYRRKRAQIPAQSVVSADILADHNIRTKEEGTVAAQTAFVEFWNSQKNLPEIKAFTPQRKTHFQARMREPLFAENWREIICRLAGSSFCTGKNDRGWLADVDWVLKNSANYAKVLEGKYDRRDTAKTDEDEYPGAHGDVIGITRDATDEDIARLRAAGVHI